MTRTGSTVAAKSYDTSSPVAEVFSNSHAVRTRVTHNIEATPRKYSGLSIYSVLGLTDCRRFSVHSTGYQASDSESKE